MFAVGCSMGANLLANLLGTEKENSVIDAAVCIQAPMKMWIVGEKIKTVANGLYEQSLGKSLINLIETNKE